MSITCLSFSLIKREREREHRREEEDSELEGVTHIQYKETQWTGMLRRIRASSGCSESSTKEIVSLPSFLLELRMRFRELGEKEKNT